MKKTNRPLGGNPDEKEKARELSPAEQRRLQAFETLADEMTAQGYRRTELTISIVKANAFAVALLIPLFIAGLGAFLLVNKSFSVRNHSAGTMLLFVLLFLALIVVHELIHGLSWAVFTEHHWKDIEFGFMKQYLTPYCTCGVPLSKGQYLFGALMPLFVLGILPMVVAVLTGSLPLLLLGIIMADSAAGDIIIAWKILRYRSGAAEIVYMDHPTQGGGVIFER